MSILQSRSLPGSGNAPQPSNRRRPPVFVALGSILVLLSLAGCGTSDEPAAATQSAQGLDLSQHLQTPSQQVEDTPHSSTMGASSEANPPEPAPTGTPSGPEPSETTSDEPSGAVDQTPGSPEDSATQDTPELQERPAAEDSNEGILSEYPDDPPPADEVAGTLCNLTKDHLEMMNSHVSDSPELDEPGLRLALISLGDQLETWEGISWHFPETQPHIETAQSIYSHWEYALGLLDIGDEVEAQQQLNLATALIDTLPGAAVAEAGCDG